MIDEDDIHSPRYLNDKLLIRKSMIEDFSWCPWKFKDVWIDRHTKTPNQAMLLGTRFHDFAYKFFDYYITLPIDEWEVMIPDQFIEKEKQWARWFINQERLRYRRLQQDNRLDEFKPILREQNIQNIKLCIESHPDRVDWYNKEDDEICITEYKTGGSVNWKSIKRQLAFYALLWENTIGLGKITKIQLINPRLRISQMVDLDPWEVDKSIQDIIKIRKAMKYNDFKRSCSPIIHPYCMLCSPSESGMYPIDE
jgi:hypothetical protein